MPKYETKELIKKSLEAIKKHDLVFVTDVVTYLPCSRALFYERQLDKVDSIKEALEDNKVQMKVKMRKKWFESQTPALQLAFMKLISSDDERRALSTSFMETKQKHEVQDLSKHTTEDLLEMLKTEEHEDEKDPDTA